MADYLSVQDMIDAGITNMTVVRNNSKNDDGVDTIPTEISWFFYNGALVSNIYISGNSFIGFGSNSEHLRVNRRDGAVYYIYKETGRILGTRFFKIRWMGYSYYNQTADSYLQQYDIFILENGIIFLNFFDVPNTTGSGTNSLTCGSESVSYSINANIPCKYTFTPNDPETGTGWTVASGEPIFSIYCPSGTAICSISISHIKSYLSSVILWDAEVPEGTSVKIESGTGSVTPDEWIECSNNMPIPSLIEGHDYTNQNLYLKVTLSTTNPYITPNISAIIVQIGDLYDQNRIALTLGNGNRNNLQKNSGEVTVRYANGDLSGEDALVENFIKNFTPVGVAYKGNQNDQEYLEISDADYSSTLSKIEYQYSQDDQNAYLSIIGATYIGSITYIEPI